MDLTEAGKYRLKPHTPLLKEEADALGRTVRHRRFSIPDMGLPSLEEMDRILDTIDEQIAAGQVVYVHCYGGIGRTGTVVGCYLVRHGLSGEAALARIARLREGTPDGGRRSPETDAQRQMVRVWSDV